MGKLSGCRIVVTRAAEGASALARRLRVRGASVLTVPAIRTTAPVDGAAVRAAIEALADASWLVFTSAAGVRFSTRTLRACWPDGLPSGVRVAAVGPGTAQAALRAQFAPAFVPERFLARVLGETLPLAAGDRVVLMRGDLARPELPERLTERGATVENVVAYRTLVGADPARLARALARDPHAVLFSSASAVRGFAMGLPASGWPEGLRTASIGPVTAEALRDAGLPVDIVAREHTLDGLVDALIELLS